MRVDITVTGEEYTQLWTLANAWQPALARQMETALCAEGRDLTTPEVVVLAVKNIRESDAADFFDALIDAEIGAEDSESLRYFGHLVELWRPLAEGPL